MARPDKVRAETTVPGESRSDHETAVNIDRGTRDISSFR